MLEKTRVLPRAKGKWAVMVLVRDTLQDDQR